MKSITNSQLNPGNLNQSQRKGLFAALALIITIVFLHFPFEGYTVQKWVITKYGTGKCPTHNSAEEVMKLSAEQLTRDIQQLRLCGDDSELQLRPFNEWASDSPIVSWFGSTVHTLAAILFVTLLGIAWIFAFRDRTQGRDDL